MIDRGTNAIDNSRKHGGDAAGMVQDLPACARLFEETLPVNV